MKHQSPTQFWTAGPEPFSTDGVLGLQTGINTNAQLTRQEKMTDEESKEPL
jgi:hypothetical protein